MSLLDFFLSMLVSAIWGGNFVASKISMAHYPPLLMTAIRFGAVTILLLPFLKKPTGKWREMFGFSVALGVVHFAMIFIGMSRGIDVPTAIITTQMGVPFSCMLGTIFLNDKLGPWRSSGLVVAFFGLMLIAGTPNVSSNMGSFLLVLGGAFAWSVSNILVKRLSDFPIMSVVGWLALLSTPQLLLLSFLFEENHWEVIRTAPLVPTLGIAYSVILSTLVAYALWYHLLSRHKVSQVVPFSLLIPFFGVGASILLLDSQLTWQMVVGAVITMCGVGIIVIRKPKIKQQGEAI